MTERITLISPDGRPYHTSNPVEITRLKAAQGYVEEGEREIATDDGLFHPAGQTVKTVQKFIDENPDQAERVLAEERAGEARKTLVGDDAAPTD